MIDTETLESPGWWLQRASNEISVRAKRLRKLQARIDGEAPLPHGGDRKLEEAYRAFQRKARSNWELRIVTAATERIRIQGFTTAVDADANGDEEATRQAREAGLFRESKRAIKDMIGLSVGYMVNGRDGARVSSTSESPFNTITFHDPITDEVRAAAKIFSDDLMGAAYGYVWVRDNEGRIRRWVAVREVTRYAKATPRIAAQSWSWSEPHGGAEGQEIPMSSVPVYRFLNEDGFGDFERHVDVLDRITHGTLQRLVLVATQAYHQRAMIGAPAEDENGNPIDYDGLHLGPGSLVDLPEGVQMWEGRQADISGILEASKDDRRELAALTATPLPVLMPDAANQSAEGAAFSKESLITRCNDRIELATPEMARCYQGIAELRGDTKRSDLSRIIPMFADASQRSLAEMADAATKAKEDLPLEERLVRIWGYDPQRAAEIADAKRKERLELAAYGGVNAV